MKPITKPISYLAHKITQKLEPARKRAKEIPKKNIHLVQVSDSELEDAYNRDDPAIHVALPLEKLYQVNTQAGIYFIKKDV